MYGLIAETFAFFHTLVYCFIMTKRLDETDWLEHGLKFLAEQGHTLLKAGYLARQLGVTRGSFYWHFTEIADFHSKLLALWRTRTTLETIDRIDQAATGQLRLNLILRQAFTADSSLERAVRAWATNDSGAAEAVAAVDRERIAYLQSILDASGIVQEEAMRRARFLYWSYLGHMMQHGNAEEVSNAEIDALAELVTRL